MNKKILCSSLLLLFSIDLSYCREIDENIPTKLMNITKFVNERCPDISDDTENIKEALMESTNCLGVVNIIKFIAMTQLNTINDVEEYLNGTCEIYDDIVFDCFDSNVEKFSQCLTEQEIEKIKIIRKIMKRLTEYYCLEDGSRVAPLFVEPDTRCFQYNRIELSNCIKPTIKKYIQFNLPSNYINEDNCRDILHLKTCGLSLLKTCKEQFPFEFFNGILNILMDEFLCEINNEVL